MRFWILFWYTLNLGQKGTHLLTWLVYTWQYTAQKKHTIKHCSNIWRLLDSMQRSILDDIQKKAKRLIDEKYLPALKYYISIELASSTVAFSVKTTISTNCIFYTTTNRNLPMFRFVFLLLSDILLSPLTSHIYNYHIRFSRINFLEFILYLCLSYNGWCDNL